jgi:hypothetical protein
MPESEALFTPDRYLFLFALQQCAPDFWQGLKASTDFGTSVECWAEWAGVVDDWLIEVLKATIVRWRERPDDSGSQLVENYEWFAYPACNPVTPFAPQFADPYPGFSGILLDASLNTYQSIAERAKMRKTQDIETPKAFRKRMTEQYNAAMTAYNKYLRQLAAQNDLRGQRKEHAQWTALVAFGDRTVAEIAERWPTLLRNKDPYSTVHKAVGRFASDIRLTIPARMLDKRSS